MKSANDDMHINNFDLGGYVGEFYLARHSRDWEFGISICVMKQSITNCVVLRWQPWI